MISINLKYISIFILIFIFSACEENVANFGNQTSNIVGQIGKGKAIQASVQAYKLDGSLIGSDNTIDSDGYTGNVKIVATLKKYYDEKLNQIVEVDNVTLNAYSSVSVNDNIVNVTPITEIAVRFIGDLKESTDTSKINKYIARLSGLTEDNNPAKMNLKYLNSNNGEVADIPENRLAIILLGVSNKSNLKQSDSKEYKTSKLNETINFYEKAILLEINDINNTQLDNMIEVKNETNTSIISNENNIVENLNELDNNLSNSGLSTQRISQIQTMIVEVENNTSTSLTNINNNIDNNTSNNISINDLTNVGIIGLSTNNINYVHASLDALTSTPSLTDIQNIVDSYVNTNTIALSGSISYIDSNTSYGTSKSYSVNETALVKGTGTVTYAITSSLITGVSINTTNGQVDFNSSVAIGTYAIEVTATSTDTGTAVDTLNVTVDAIALSGSISYIDSNTSYGTSKSYSVNETALVKGTGTVTYAITSSAITGVSINTTNGQVDFNSSVAVGTYAIEVTATSTDTGTATDTLNVTLVKGTQAQIVISNTKITKLITDANFTNISSGGEGTGIWSISTTGDSIIDINSTTGELSILKAGTASILISKAGDSNYNSAIADNNFTLFVQKEHALTSSLGNNFTFERNSTATMIDFEGNVRVVNINEPRFTGSRRVENLSGKIDLNSSYSEVFELKKNHQYQARIGASSTNGASVVFTLGGFDGNITADGSNDKSFANGKSFDTSGLMFDGVDDYIDANGDINISNKAFSIAVAVKSNGSSAGTVVGAGASVTGNNTLIHLRMDATNVRFGLWSDDLDHNVGLQVGVWEYYVFTLATDLTRKLYKNGQLVENDTASNYFIGSENSLRIGMSSAGGDIYGGGIKDVHVYDRAVTLEEVQSLYNSSIVPSGAIKSFLLNETSGSIAHDSSGNGFDANLTGGLAFISDRNVTISATGDIKDFQIEDVTNQSNQNPSEYVGYRVENMVSYGKSFDNLMDSVFDSVSGEYTITGNATANGGLARIAPDNGYQVDFGKTFGVSFEAKYISGEATVSLDIGDKPTPAITLNSQWKRYYRTINIVDNGNHWDKYLFLDITYYSQDANNSLKMRNIEIVDLTQVGTSKTADKIPYTRIYPGVKHFDYKHNNTVDASGIISEVQGDDINTSILKGILLEKSSTNLTPYSNIEDNITRSLDYSTSVFNVKENAYLVSTPNTTGVTYISSVHNVTNANTPYAVSFELKAKDISNVGKYVDFWTYDHVDPANEQEFILTSEWVRHTVVFSNLAIDANAQIRALGTNNSNNSGNPSHNDNTAKEFYVKNTQIEESTFSTSFIPTNGLAVTREVEKLKYNYNSSNISDGFKLSMQVAPSIEQGEIINADLRLFSTLDANGTADMIRTSGTDSLSYSLINNYINISRTLMNKDTFLNYDFELFNNKISLDVNASNEINNAELTTDNTSHSDINIFSIGNFNSSYFNGYFKNIKITNGIKE